jgi:DNA-binding MarR family transcriptional regulator
MNDHVFDLDRLRLPTRQPSTHVHSISTGRKPSPNASRVEGEFLKGPIPLDWLGRASKLPGKAPLATAIAIMFEVGRRRSPQVTLTTAILDRFGVNRKAKYRGLKQLEKAGLIKVDRRPRRNPVVTVLAVQRESLAESDHREVTVTAQSGEQSSIATLIERSKQCLT